MLAGCAGLYRCCSGPLVGGALCSRLASPARALAERRLVVGGQVVHAPRAADKAIRHCCTIALHCPPKLSPPPGLFGGHNARDFCEKGSRRKTYKIFLRQLKNVVLQFFVRSLTGLFFSRIFCTKFVQINAVFLTKNFMYT